MHPARGTLPLAFEAARSVLRSSEKANEVSR